MRGIKSKIKSKPKKFRTTNTTSVRKFRRRVLSVSQLLGKIRLKRQQKLDYQKRQKPIKPVIPPKSLIIILKEKPQKALYNRRIIDYKHCGLLQRYIGLGGKILSRRKTRLTAKQQRYIAKTIKTARIMGLLPFVNKEKGYFR
jgi:small subunit ribosomal protein S18